MKGGGVRVFGRRANARKESLEIRRFDFELRTVRALITRSLERRL